MRKVDCRDCKFYMQIMDAYINVDNFDDVVRMCRGSILGYCSRRGACVTYFKGFCRLFEPRLASKTTLFDYAKGARK